MFHLAGIACRDLGVNAQMNQPVRQQGVAFIDVFGDFSSFVCQSEIALFGNGDVFPVFHIFYSDAHAGFGKIHFGRHVDGTHCRETLTQDEYGFEVILQGFLGFVLDIVHNMLVRLSGTYTGGGKN